MTLEAKQTSREALLSLVSTAVDESVKNNIRTTLPGYFLKFDPATQLAEIQVGIERLDVFGKSFTPPPIVNCPVCLYGASGGLLEVEIQPGDEVLIHFSMRCIDGWRDQGGVAPLVSKQLFRHSDAFVSLAPRSSQNAIQGYSNEGIKLRSVDGATYAWIRNDKSVELANDSGMAALLPDGDWVANGAKMTAAGKVVTAAGVDLDAFKALYDAHVHGGVTSGSGSTGIPA